MKKISGVQEWASASYNCVNGCAHNCRYCYAKKMAIRFGKKQSATDWAREELIDRPVKKMPGRVMLPTTHDITPGNYRHVVGKILEHLRAGNELLIVSKAHYSVTKSLAIALKGYENRVTFRLSIGTLCVSVTSFWEPDAPPPCERIEALRLLHEAGYKTSVSSEPFLWADIAHLIELCAPYITDSHWIGRMNRHSEPGENIYTQKLAEIYRPEYLRELYQRYKDNPKIKWKESLKQVLGLELIKTKGADK